MRHEEARRRVRLGPDSEAEAHLAVCAGCFAAIEKEDVLLLALRKAKPEPAAAPERLAASVLSRWTWRRRLPWLVGGGGLAAASLAAAAVLWLLAATFSEPLSVGGSAVGAVVTPLVALLTAFTDLLRARFLDPGWFSALIVVAALGAAGTAVLYREAQPAGLRARA